MWEFPFITSVTLADQRVTEEFAKRGSGERKVDFPISMSWVNVLDVFTNFKLQDPFAIDKDGVGDSGAYYYVEDIVYDFIKEQLKIVAIDMMWVLVQFCMLGDETTLPGNWIDPVSGAIAWEDRIYCYLCDEVKGEFADREVGKMLTSEQ